MVLKIQWFFFINYDVCCRFKEDIIKLIVFFCSSLLKIGEFHQNILNIIWVVFCSFSFIINTMNCTNRFANDSLYLLLFSHPVRLFETPWTAAQQASMSLAISQSFPSSYPLHHWCHPAISSSDALFSFCLQSFPQQGLFQWVDYSHKVTKIPELQLQHRSFQWIFRVDFL